MASVAVLGAAGYAGAIAAQLLYRHPSFELAHVTARARGRAAARRRAPAHARAAGARGATTPTARASTPPSSPTRTARRRRSSPSCATAACASSICPPTSGCATAAIYEDWYGEHKAPELLRAGRLRAAGAAPASRSRARTSWPTRAATRPPRCSALAPLARAGLIGDVVIDAKSGVSRRRPRGDGDHALHLRRRERLALQDRGPPPHAGDRAGARRARQRRDDHVHAAPAAARPGRARVVLRDAVARGRRRTSSRELYDDAYAREPFIELRERPASACSTCATRNYCRISSHHDPRTGRVIVFAAIDNLWKGAASQAVQNLNLMFGRPGERRGCCELRWLRGPGARHRGPGELPARLPRRRRGLRPQAERRARRRPAGLPRRTTASARRGSRAPACWPRRSC